MQCSEAQQSPAKDEPSLQFEQLFVENYNQYTMDIAAAGRATLPTVFWSSDGALIIEYTYQAGTEKRTGSMVLQTTKAHHYEGNWKTVADSGQEYAGSLYFDFKKDGTANGYYQFAGNSYKITIDL